MSAIIETVVVPSGVSLYAFIRDMSGQVWNGSSFESYDSDHWSDYAVALTEQSNSSYFKADFPSSISAGKYSIVIHQGAGDIGDTAVDSASMDWNGTTENYLGVVVAKLPTGAISSFDSTTDTVDLGSNQSGVTIGTVNALGTSAGATVKAQVDASLGSDAITELSGVPSATPTVKAALMLLFMALRNKRTSTATQVKVYNASGAAIATANQSDNGTTYAKEVFS